MTSSPAAPPSREVPISGRLRALDGLRGIAALVVVVHHALLLIPAMSLAQLDESAAGQPATVWLLTHTPAHLVWAGEEAVLVFFVLSGFVLTLPAVGRPMRWRTYYPRRLVRLYLPVWGSVALTGMLVLAVPPSTSPARSVSANNQARVELSQAWHDVFLLPAAGAVNTPLWSLHWEVLFSLLLPAFLLLRLGARRALPLYAALLIAAVGVGTYAGIGALRYLPVFGLGVLLAFHRDLLEDARRWVDSRQHAGAWWVAALTVTVLLFTGRWIASGLPSGGPLLDALASGGVIVGALLVVVLALVWAPGARALERRAVQWLGARSFSLYLVHLPVIFTLEFVFPTTVPRWVVIAVAIPTALVVTAVFFRLVEAPSHRAARGMSALAGPSRPRAPEAAQGRPAGPPEVPGRVIAVIPFPRPAAEPQPVTTSRPTTRRQRAS